MTMKIPQFSDEIRKFRNSHDIAEFTVTHPQWERVVQDFAARLGIKPPRIVRVPTRMVNARVDLSGTLFVSDGLMKMLDCSHLSAPSRPMQAVIAHELGHLKFDMPHLRNINRLPETILKHTLWLAVPEAALLAFGLYEYATNALPKDPQGKDTNPKILKHVDGAIETTLREERRDLQANGGNPEYLTWLKGGLYHARYWIVGGLGTAAGIAAHRYVGRASEFRADRVAIELMGESESFNVLKERFPKEAHRLWLEMNPKPQAGTFGERLWNRIETEFRGMKGKILDPHPSWVERGEAAKSHLARLQETGHPLDTRPF